MDSLSASAEIHIMLRTCLLKLKTSGAASNCFSLALVQHRGSVQDWSLQCPSNAIWPFKIYLSPNNPSKCFLQIHVDFMREIWIFIKTLEIYFLVHVTKYQRCFHEVTCYYWQKGPICHIIEYVIIRLFSVSQMCHVKAGRTVCTFQNFFHPLWSIHITLLSILLWNYLNLSRHTVRAKNLNATSYRSGYPTKHLWKFQLQTTTLTWIFYHLRLTT